MPRGRPRQYDEDAALTAAMVTFWQKGLSATSLDDLADAMKMNRPSIYAAFGNKETLYRRSLARFCGQLDAGLAQTLDAETDLRAGLMGFFDQAIDVYCGRDQAMGCLMMCTAPAEALAHPGVGDDLKALIDRLDRALAARLRRARRDGEIANAVSPTQTARLLQATLHSLALRARAGESAASLRRLGRHAVERLLG